MTRRWPGLLVGLLCGLCAIVASGSAESGWGLWVRTASKTETLLADEEWQRLTVTPTKQECIEEGNRNGYRLAMLLSGLRAGEPGNRVSSNHLTAEILAVFNEWHDAAGGTHSTTTFYHCLPDPVDPRGLKRK